MSFRSVLANLGFIFQMSAMFILLPITLAFYYRELESLVSFFVTTTVFFALLLLVVFALGYQILPLVLGRIEVIPLLVALTPVKLKKINLTK